METHNLDVFSGFERPVISDTLSVRGRRNKRWKGCQINDLRMSPTSHRRSPAPFHPFVIPSRASSSLTPHTQHPLPATRRNFLLYGCYVKDVTGFAFLHIFKSVLWANLNVKSLISKSDVWLTVHRNSVWIRKTN